MLKGRKLFWRMLLLIFIIFFLTGGGLQAETGTEEEAETLFSRELVSMLEEAFAEDGWRGVQEMIANGEQSGAEGSQSGANGEHSGADGSQSEKDEQQLHAVGFPVWSEGKALGEEGIFQHFPLTEQYRDRFHYDDEIYDAVSYLYQGPKDIYDIYGLPERDRGKYALVYESGKSGGRRAYSVRLADLEGDALATVAEFDVQDYNGLFFRYGGEYYYIYGWKSDIARDGKCDGFMLHRLSGNPKRETLLVRRAPGGELIWTEGVVFKAERPEDLFTPSERRMGQSGYIVYDNRWDFEENRNLPYADDRTFERLKEAYGEVGFFGEFQQSDSETNAIYIEAFRKLVGNEVTFYDRESGKEYYLKDYEGVQLDIREEGVYDPGRFEYYFFDADGDGYPELGILEEYPEGHSAFLYLFRYDMDTERYSLWISLYPPYDRLLGTRKVLEYDGVHMKMDYGYYQLDPEGEVECKAYLYYLPISMFEQLCLVMLPAHTDASLNAKVTRGMEQCGIYARESGEWYFRVTKEQFEELEKAFWEAREAAQERQTEALYSYEELFGRRDC